MYDIRFKTKKIKMVATDIDGVWTDAKMYYSKDGDYMKAFSTYDGVAVRILKEMNIIVVVITSEESLIVSKRVKKLGVNHLYQGEYKKLERLKYLCKRYNIKMDEVAYIGDDINDLDALKNVGLSAMPINSPILQLFNPDIIIKSKGGYGAFREFVDIIQFNR